MVLCVVTKAHRLEFIDCFAGIVHRFNVMLVPTRRDVAAAKSAVAVDGNPVWVGANLRLNVRIDLSYKTAVAHVLTKGADGNNLVRGTDGGAGGKAQCDIVVAATVVTQRNATYGGVGGADGIIKERAPTNGRICCAGGVAEKGSIAVGGVKATSDTARPTRVVSRAGIAKESERSSGRILDASRIT